ncbi:hypothetical protein IV203_016277 [Nitzschia inconspicua]|uniref:Uncharacterized protein n=1 Tax=Nitzschia inconspicua TaxID=303405 RepID=A0A9K3KQB0_9STRA|nr:hypothetical protein IV203_016277 [Nitzschia inconspicua]
MKLLNETVALVPVETGILDDSNHHEGDDRNSEQDPPSKGLSSGEDKHCDFQRSPDNSPRANEALLGNKTKESFQETKEKCALVSKVSHTSLNEAVALVSVETGILDDSNQHGIVGQEIGAEGEETPISGKDMQLEESGHSSPLMQDCDPEGSKPIQSPSRVDTNSVHVGVGNAVNVTADVILHRSIDVCRESGPFVQTAHSESHLDFDVEGNNFKSSEFSLNDGLQHPDSPLDHNVTGNSFVSSQSTTDDLTGVFPVKEVWDQDSTNDQSKRKDDDSVYTYEERLLELERNGEELNDDELFVLDIFIKRKEGKIICQEELDQLHLLKNQERGRQQDSKELKDLKHRSLQGQPVDEERIYVLELFQKFRDGKIMNEVELFELDAYDRIRSGEELSVEDLDDLMALRDERAAAKVDLKELENLRLKYDGGEAVDEARLFELEIKAKVRQGVELNDEEMYALELFDKINSGEELTDVENDDLTILLRPASSAEVDRLEPTTESSEPPVSDLQNTVFQGNENDPVDDPSIERIPSDACQADNRDENLEFFNDQKEIVTHEDLTAPFNKDKELQGVDKEQDKVTLSFLKELTSIREMRDRGLDYDEDLLYELELLAKGESGEMMDDDELFKVDMFEKRSMGTVLNVMELDELELLKKRTIDRKLDEDELQALRERLCHGEEVDEDLLYELELFEKMRFGDPLTEDELFELDIFQLIRDGVALSEEQIHELEILKGERMEAALDEEDLRIMRETKARGEPVDEDFLYELELFQRKRNGDSLTKDEELELALFQRRRDEEELQEDDAIKLEILRNKRIGKANNPGTTAARKLAGSDIDDDSVYRRTLLDRQMKGQRLDKQEFVWLELLQKAKRGDSLLEEELDELDVMRKQRKEATSDVEVEQTRKLLEKEMEKRTRRDLKEQRRKERAEKKIQRRLEKEEKREQKRKEKEHEKMLRERRAKVKKMRKKRDKHRDKEGGRKKGESVTKDLETSKEELSVRTQANTAVEIVNMPPVPFLATKSEEAKIGLFGGVFGRNKKSKKELELEEARRRQEELIKEQMKALALENELRELEKEKELQKELVRETVDRKSTGSAGSSSWETDSAAEGQESDDESSVTSSSEESESDSESDGSLESTESFGEETDEKFPENVVVSERRPMRVAKRREMNLRLRMSILHRQELRGMTVDATATKKVSDGHPESEPVLLMEHPDDASSASIEPPAQLAGKSLTEVVDRPTKGKSRTITLSAHLRKKNKKRTSRKHKARYGDELSLGTTQLSKIAKATKTEIDVVESDNNFLKQEVDRMLDKSDRPWIAESDMNQVDHFSTIEPPRKEVNKPYVEKFFNISNQHVFDRSVFNFNQSFGSKMSVVNEDNGSRSRESLSESESVASGKLVQEGEIGSIKEPNDPEDVISLVESLSSFVSLSEQKYIFETPDYETIETRLAEKLRTKEAEFDAAWETIVADENVAAQISQRLRERQRTTRSDVKKDDKDVELNGYYNVPRLFLFEGEKTKSKKTKRNKKRKDRKLQKKLDRTLSKEFRKAMREVFESDSEDEYDKTFGEHEDGEVEGTPDRRKAMGRLHTDLSDNSLNESGSAGSDQSDDFDHGGYMARLRDRSMQQEVRKVLYESRRQLMAASNHSHLSSDDDISQNSDISHREKSGDKPKNNEKKQPKKKRAKKNRNGELVGEDIDPADVYAKELEKQKEKKTFTVADLRKEMEELKQVNFGPPPADTAQNVKKLKTPKKPKSSANIASSGGMPIQRPGLGNKLQSFTTAASELEDDDEEEAFLTGGRNTSGDFDDDMGGFNDSKASGGFGFRGAGLSNFNFFSGAASSKTPSKSSKKKTAGFRGSFGAGSSNSVIGDLVNVGPPLASPGGFQEPLPVPDMQDEEKGKGRRSSMFSLMGMGSKRLIPKFTIPSKRMSGADGGGGFMMDDDDDDQFEGGMGLLG